MKKTKLIYFILIFVILCFGMGVWYQQNKTDSALNQFFKSYRIKKQDMNYGTVERSFLGKGLIFYRVVFPQLLLTHKIDKIIVNTKGETVNIQLIGVQIDIIDTLRRSQNIKILSVLHAYKPFEDALKKPLQSLALMGIDDVKVNVTLSFEPFKDIIIVNGKVTAQKLADIYFSFALERVVDRGYQKNLIYAFYGNIEDVFFEIKDRGVFKKYKAYIVGLGLPSNSTQMSRLISGQPIVQKMKLEKPLPLMKLYRSVPKKESIPTF